MSKRVTRVGLGVRERELECSLSDSRQHALPLQIAAAARDELCTERDGGEPRLDDQRSADRVHQAHRIDCAPTQAAVRGGKRQAEQPHLGHRPPNVEAEPVG